MEQGQLRRRRSSRTSGRGDLRHVAMATLAMLRSDPKKLLTQVKQLVKSKPEAAARVFTTDVDGWTPIHACAMRGSRKLFKAMMASGIDVDAVMGEPQGLPGRCTLLHVAANRKSPKVLEFLLSRGANVSARDSQGRTAVHYAQANGNKEALKLLQSHGALVVDLGAQAQEHAQITPPEELMTPEPRLNKFCFSLHR